MTWLLGFVLVIVGLVRLDDADPGHLRLGRAAIAVGVVLLVVESIAEWRGRDDG